jgi:hypothetical protein
MVDLTPLFVCGFWSTLYWIIAIGMSVFWGRYGIIYENDNKKARLACESEHCEHNVEKPSGHSYMVNTACFLSDFAWSFIGWCSLYLLLSQYCDKELVSLNVFLGIIAVVGITGYGSRIPEKMKIG